MDCKWANSGLYTLMSSVYSATLERTTRSWVSWDNYIVTEGATVAAKQKELGLVEDVSHYLVF